MALGNNKAEYEVIEGWELLPEGWSFVRVSPAVALGNSKFRTRLRWIVAAQCMSLIVKIHRFRFSKQTDN